MTTPKAFDELLVLQYRSGDKKALGLLVKRHHHRFCRHAYWYTRDLDASKDIVQDCWSIVMVKLEFLKDSSSFGSWALRIVTRKSLDFLNRKTRNREKLKGFRPTIDNVYGEEDRGNQMIGLQKAIEQLPDNQQIVLRLFYTEDYSIKEIGMILEISVGTVKSRLFHAREKLKSIVKR